MDNRETLAKLVTQDTERRPKQKNKKQTNKQTNKHKEITSTKQKQRTPKR
jgi:hypothetical protein